MRHAESDIQIQAVRIFRLTHPSLAKLLFAVPNGGARNRVTGAILKAEGVVAGVADLLLLVPTERYHGLCIEMKRMKGRQQDSQKEWQALVEGQGYRYIVCHSVTEFLDGVEAYLAGK